MTCRARSNPPAVTPFVCRPGTDSPPVGCSSPSPPLRGSAFLSPPPLRGRVRVGGVTKHAGACLELPPHPGPPPQGGREKEGDSPRGSEKKTRLLRKGKSSPHPKGGAARYPSLPAAAAV